VPRAADHSRFCNRHKLFMVSVTTVELFSLHHHDGSTCMHWCWSCVIHSVSSLSCCTCNGWQSCSDVALCQLTRVVDRGADTLIQQAQGWESKGEYLRAIECYARVTADVTADPNVLQRCWVKVSHFHGLFVFCLISVCE